MRHIIVEVTSVILLLASYQAAGEVITPATADTAAVAAKPVLVEKAAGKVSAERVNIRGGPGSTYNVIVTVDKNTELQVRSYRDGWYEVELPKGAGCWIYKDYIKVDVPAGGIEAGAAIQGEIVGTKVHLRAAPDMMSSNVLGELEKGTKVDVLSKSGDWFKIRPPEGTTGWIAAKYVTLAPGVRVSGEPLPGQTSKAVIVTDTEEAPLPVSTGTEPPAIQTGTSGGVALPALSDSSKADHMMAEELKKPPMERDFSQAIAIYNKILTSSASDEEKKAAQARLRQIFTLTPRRELAGYMLELSGQVESELKKTDKRYTPQIEALRAKLPPSRYTARGVLYQAHGEASGVRYRLKMGDVTVYFLKASGTKYDYLIGREVGVIGEVLPAPPGFDTELLNVATMEPTR